MPATRADEISLVVIRLLISSASVSWLSSIRPRTSRAARLPLSITVRRSLSLSRSVVVNRLRSCENDRIDDSLSSWVWSATRLFLISSLVTPRLAYAVSMNELLVSMIVAQVRTGALERRPELVDDRAEVALVHAVDERVEVDEQLGSGQRGPRVVPLDRRAVPQVGPGVALRLQVDVLLTDRRTVRDHGDHVGRGSCRRCAGSPGRRTPHRRAAGGSRPGPRRHRGR